MKQYSMVNATTDADTWKSFWTTESVFELRIETKIRSVSFSQFLFTTIPTKKAWKGLEP